MAAVTLRARSAQAEATRRSAAWGTWAAAAWDRPRLSARERTHWLRQLALLLRAGVPLLVAMDGARPRRSKAGDLWVKVHHDVEAGRGLAASLEQHPHAFDAFCVRMIGCGEMTGTLDVALERVADQEERQQATRRSVRRAFVYPTLVLGVAALAIAVMLVFVVPVFAEIFTGEGEALPWPTRVVLACSEWATAGIPLAALVLVGALLVSLPLRRRPSWRTQRDTVLLRVPWLGDVVRSSAVARAADSLATLLSGGLPLLEALPVAADTSGNSVIADGLRNARGAVSGGQPLSAALGHDDAWPDLAVQLIRVGETTGSLDAMLERTAQVLRREADERVALLLMLLEPAIILSLAVVVGSLVVAMYLPVFRLGALI